MTSESLMFNALAALGGIAVTLIAAVLTYSSRRSSSLAEREGTVFKAQAALLEALQAEVALLRTRVTQQERELADLRHQLNAQEAARP